LGVSAKDRSRAGKKVDETVEAAKDKLNPDGPVEKLARRSTRRSTS
jgi:hypothetical protein